MTLETFYKIYPWEEKYQIIGVKRLDWFWHFDLDISVESLWSYVSDTSRLNQALGLSKMNFEEKDGNLYGRSKNSGVTLEWIEIPWVWIYSKHLISIREYSKGLAHTVKAIYHFEKLSDTKTRFYVYLGWIPRGFFYKLMLLASESVIRKKYSTILLEIEKLSKTNKTFLPLDKRETESKIEKKELIFKITDELIQKQIRKELISKLINHIEYGNDLDLYRLRPLELAAKWNYPAREVVIAFMYATRLGLLNISWDTICPHCRGTRIENGSLYDVQKKAKCDVCDIDFENESENSIEITFHIHPSVRIVEKVFFCSAEPAKKPHIKLQKFLEPNEILTCSLSLGIGTYKLRAKGKDIIGNLEITDSESTKSVNWSLGDNQNYVAAENPEIRIINTDNVTRLFSLEETVWDPFILKPAYLFSLQEFHDLFSTDSIASDLKLELGMQTIFFTDIVGSSTLYELQGDSKTFVQVKKHFEEINKIVKENEGAIIKTIGDAVMAAFPSPSGAIEAAVSLRKEFNGEKNNSIQLRMSIHFGQCIAVSLNSGIDYFGKTVNIAAKIQKLAGASQIVFTKEYKDNPEVILFLESNNILIEEIKYSIPGMKDEFTIYRIDAN
ncbi:MAG: adenylate/guanylate cyclase domain-containing protein [Leptospiraceae bacterium]|nr:adenylate/guanylate cyclase domain-containing protein [Leptospiraceae bacterium]